MKKIWMMLLMISTVFAFSACSDDDDDKVPVNPVPGATINSPVEIGETLQVKGTGFVEGAQFYFTDGEWKSEAFKAAVNASGASFTVPLSMKPGEYTLVLKQDGDWEIGKVTLNEAKNPVGGFSVPTTAFIGKTMTIAGAGFNETSEVYLQKEGSEPIELPIASEDFSAGLICEIPSELEAGSYTVIFKQDGGEWTWENELVVEKAPKRLKKITKVTDLSMLDMGTMEFGYFISWQNDEPNKFTLFNKSMFGEVEINYAIEKTNGQIIGSTEDEDANTQRFTLTLNGNEVAQTIATEWRQNKWVDHTREWKYGNDGYLSLLYDNFYEPEDEPGSPNRVQFKYESDNLVEFLVNNNSYCTYSYTDKEYNRHNVEWAVCYAILTNPTIVEDYFYTDLPFAVLTNMIGKKSVLLPEKADEIIFTYILDDASYLLRVDWEEDGMPIYATFEYEE